MAIREKGTGDSVTSTPSACRRCGCKDFRVRGSRAFCRHCGKPKVNYAAKQEETKPGGGDIHHVVRCPACNGDQVKITHTRKPVRFYKCKVCSHTFKRIWV